METSPHRALWLLVAVLAGCSAPERIARHRSPLLDVATSPWTPEGRPNAVPVVSPAFPRPIADGVDGAAVAVTARGFIGRTRMAAKGKRFPDDCTGLVRAVYASHGIDLLAEGYTPGENGVTAIYRYAARHGTLFEEGLPQPGDIVFFRETYDRNRDGRENDGLTHIGVVEEVAEGETIHVIHRVDRGVVRYRMNLARPSSRKDASGKVVNDYLRPGKKPRLTAELFAGFARIAAPAR